MSKLGDCVRVEIVFNQKPGTRHLELNQLALWNRVPFGKFNRASAFPVRL